MGKVTESQAFKKNDNSAYLSSTQPSLGKITWYGHAPWPQFVLKSKWHSNSSFLQIKKQVTAHLIVF